MRIITGTKVLKLVVLKYLFFERNPAILAPKPATYFPASPHRCVCVLAERELY